ncbi:alpha/beta hydrolase family protein [Streptomyces sp. PT12]|uniref:alpha/beta hydrolase n=1 Tax=Streptomyces sp. PT12 TaxID=1510197 RepID=UPI00215C5669|nr:alpha/beta hydrolase-fold protein [Streptomyces sp. PT12]
MGASVLLAAVPTGPAAAAPARGAEGARVVEERGSGERITDLTVSSPALGGEGRVRLLTPEGWEERGAGDSWPVLYLLPGGDGDHLTWTVDFRIQDLPELRDTVVVMPDMPLFGFYSDWWNGGAGGPPAVATYHLDEVVPLLERRYGAGERRVAAGLSQGGFGAVSYAARNPGMFRAVASYSGFVHPLAQRRLWAAHDLYHLAHRLRGVPVYLASGDGRLGALDPPGTSPDEEVPGLEDPENPFPDDVLSPTETLMGEESRLLAERLRAAGADVTTHFYAGTHAPAYWEAELRRSLPMLLEALHGETRFVPSAAMA